MELPLLSVIIPIYNVEDYIAKSVESVINQVYKNLEIILVNDGSTDKSEEICKEYARIDPRVRIINKPNEGLSSARNAGLEIATGDYITFIDSDDYIEPDTYVSNMDIFIKNKNIEALQFPVMRQNKINSLPDEPYLISGEKDLFANWWRNNIITASVCNKIFRKEVFDMIRFPLGQTYEDYFLIVDFSEIIQNVYLSNRGLYHYILRDDSITTSNITIKKCVDYFRAHVKVYKKVYSYEDLRPYRIIAFSRVYRKLITARRTDHKINLEMYIKELEKYMPQWKDIIYTKSDIKEKFWFFSVKIFGIKNFTSLYARYLDIKKVAKTL